MWYEELSAPIPLSRPPPCWLAVKYKTFSQTKKYAPDFTVVNYWQKFPANLAQIAAAGGKRVHHTQYTHFTFNSPLRVLWQNLRPVAHNLEKPHMHYYLPLPHLYIYLPTYHGPHLAEVDALPIVAGTLVFRTGPVVLLLALSLVRAVTEKQGVIKRCRLSWRPRIRVQMRGGGSCGVSANKYNCAHHVTWSSNKLWTGTSTSIVNLCCTPTNIRDQGGWIPLEYRIYSAVGACWLP